MLTTLSIPKSCLTETWLSTPAHTSNGNPAIVVGNPYDTNCWPGNRDLATTITPAVCPDGYVRACDIDAASRRDESETLWACCPSKFYCDGGTWSCLFDRTTGVTRTYVVTDIDISGNTITTRVTSDRGVNAHSIRVALHSSDILNQISSTTNTDSPTEASTPAPAPTLTPSLSTPSSNVESPTPNNSENLSTGAWVGIGVGVTIGIILLLSGIVWAVVRQYKRKQQFPSVQDTPGPSKPKSPVHEIDSTIRPSELPSVPGLYELDADTLDTVSVIRRQGT
ncbi:hypothetical protein F4859DRAFT_312411 [Xylaria cf. heliscus]|nr:hypothetical protein F4859DRAFT_312411 [Xylaria cf. heliscus]